MATMVYQIKNTENGKTYIGSTVQEGNRRLVEHKSRLRHNNHGNAHLQRAWNKYGAESFEFSTLVKLDTDIDTLRIIERMYLRNLEPEYNMSMYPTRNYMYGRTGDKHPNYGKTMFRQAHTKESKRLMSVNHPGRKLDELKVANIKILYKQGNITHKELAKMYSVNQSVITRIINGKAWKHTEGDN